MAVIVKPAGKLLTPLVQPGGTLTAVRGGGHTASRTFWIDESKLLQFKPVLNRTGHPVFRTLLCDRVDARQMRGRIWSVTATYFGFLGNGDEVGFDGGDITVRGSSQELDIQNHPKFVDWAGTPTDPKNDARFGASGDFMFFGPSAPYGLRGVSRYLSPIMEVNTEWASRNQELLSFPALVDRVPGTGYPGLRIGASSVLRGGAWRCSAQFLVGNFSNTIYGTGMV